MRLERSFSEGGRLLGSRGAARSIFLFQIYGALFTTGARGSVGDLLYHGSIVWSDGEISGGVVPRLVEEGLVLGSRGQRVVGIVSRRSLPERRSLQWVRGDSPYPDAGVYSAVEPHAFEN